MNKLKATTLITPTTVYAEAERRLRELRIIVKEAESFLAKAPKGKIRFTEKGGNLQFYLRTNPEDKTGMYLSKGNTKIIADYLQKNYDEKLVSMIRQEIHILEVFLSRSVLAENQQRSLYSSLPSQVKALLQPVDCSDEDYVAWWLNIPFTRKPLPENMPVYNTANGEAVRSKSELMIANALSSQGIPYKYECPLLLGNKVIHPDFTVLNPLTRQEFYWEHRGMMDDREYSRHAVARVKDYRSCGYLPGIQLILSEETSTQPLGTDEIHSIIDQYFA